MRDEFGPFVEAPPRGRLARTERDVAGDDFLRILSEMVAIVRHQWHHSVQRSALRGFLLYGGVGLGKTTMAKRLTYELCRLFCRDLADDAVVLLLLDGATIARGRYGESEKVLRDLFALARNRQAARNRPDQAGAKRTVLLFDDVESLFLSRSAAGAKEWHFSQNSVFFHNVDTLDTASTVVILTTNRIDMLDEAIVDRFRPYEFAVPSVGTLEELARSKAEAQGLTEQDIAPILAQMRTPGAVSSIRQLERLIIESYVRKVVDEEDEDNSGVSLNAAG